MCIAIDFGEAILSGCSCQDVQAEFIAKIHIHRWIECQDVQAEFIAKIHIRRWIECQDVQAEFIAKIHIRIYVDGLNDELESGFVTVLIRKCIYYIVAPF